MTFYQITGHGIQAYSKWIKDYLDFARTSVKERSEMTKVKVVIIEF